MQIDMPDIIVVGAGPAGSTVARDLAAAGFDVVVLEEHAAAGLPEHCTGIVGEEIFAAFDLPRHLVRTPLKRFRVFSPARDRHFDLAAMPGTASAAYVLDRAALDRHLCVEAQRAGARYLFGARVRSVDDEGGGVRVEADVDGVRRVLQTRLCVLACGAMTNLPARSGLIPPRAFHRTAQATWRVSGLTDAEVFLGQSVAQGSFGYAVSLGDGTAKVGVIHRGEARSGYRRVLEQALGGRVESAVSRDTYRRIPMGGARRTVAGRVVAVGDAAGQTKTTTGGGIYYAMRCGRLLAQTIIDARHGHDLRVAELAAYEKRWRAMLGLDLQAGLWLRGVFEQVADEDVSRLVEVVDTARVREVITRSWRFDSHRGLLLGLMALPEMRRPVIEAVTRRMRARRLFGFVSSLMDGRALVAAAAEASGP